MAKYDVNGDGVFSAEEVRNIVRDLEDTEEKAKNMGRLALAVTVGGFALCLALIGLMVAANEASKENHVDGAVNVDLSGNPVQGETLKSFASLTDFPTLAPEQLNKIKYVSFTAAAASFVPTPAPDSTTQIKSFKMRFAGSRRRCLLSR